MTDQRTRYTGTFFSYSHSSDGKAIFRVTLSRTNRVNRREHLFLEVEIDRSSIGCMVHGLKQFAEREREAVRSLPL